MLKLLAEIFGLAPDATEEAVLEAARTNKAAAGETALWKARALDNLTKLEKGAKDAKQIEELQADVYFMKQKNAFKITAAEEGALRKMYLSGPQGREVVEELVAKRADQEYLSRVTALQNVRQEAADPIAERDAKANELVAKSGGKMPLADAVHKVHTDDPELFARVEVARRERSAGTKGGAR
jgi:hypothetical protein